MSEDAIQSNRTIQPDVQEVFDLRHCPDCGYLLHGLPRRGRCPECGSEYDSSRTIVLYGWGAGGDATAANARPWVATVRIIVLVVIIAAIGWIALEEGASANILAAIGVAIAASVAFFLYRVLSRRNGGPPPRQLRLQPDGFGACDGFSPVELTPWTRELAVQLDHGLNRLWRLKLVWWKISGALCVYEAADLVFDAKRETAEHVRDQIEQWIRSAHPEQPQPERPPECRESGGV